MPEPARRSGAHLKTPLHTLGSDPVAVVRRFLPSGGGVLPAAHAHDHMVLTYFEANGGTLGSAKAQWQCRAGDIFLAAPGEIYDARGLAGADGWGVFFAPQTVAQHDSGALLFWRSHPLLFPFALGSAPRPRRFRVPPAERGWWSTQLRGLDAELRGQREAFHHAALAHVTLLLVAVARLAADIPAELRLNGEPLLASVFRIIEQRYANDLSLRDVAEGVSLTPGHLTTVVRRKTGRTVQAWITERRMAEARQTLLTSDRSVGEVARLVGFRDASYFVRAFKQIHGKTPRAFRRAG